MTPWGWRHRAAQIMPDLAMSQCPDFCSRGLQPLPKDSYNPEVITQPGVLSEENN